ncbi:ribosomal protection-like ABC-F family protein [Bacillus glycinifermentans]|uniref:ABC transporter ATP-binding protein n=1 Tax=Bacillus glycinifermentans TaxID=1664069 RepID=A0A0T6BLR3_9BACI|nr:ABC-F type ribosomal protection protein [Bacillus glycinifermentans]ATH94852.1 ABC transporter ATP-binding protein [Bacillus glycinifermentans]KRT92128.1 ABC transporter ATP-binding protein [Bacillus glycinifermentans]MEC0486807.1 ABC-F type ribosomal protection protein [Bacillus glycinifermentans]
MAVCSVQNVTQSYGGHAVLSGVSCEIKQGERIGLIGRNGEGKTTLLRLMSGQVKPDEGLVTWKKGISAGLLKQSAAHAGEQTVKELLFDVFASLWNIQNQLSAIERRLAEEQDAETLERLLERYGALQDEFQQKGGYEISSQIERVAAGLKISRLLDAKWRDVSGGERTKVGLARLLLSSPDLLLLDEPTNHLDLDAVEWLTTFVKQYKGTAVIVSHDRYFLDDVATSIFEIDQGELHVYQGDYSGYTIEREERLIREFQHYQDQQKKIKKMKETIKRLKEWANRANPSNEGLHRRAKSMEKALARIDVLKKPALDRKKIDLAFKMNDRSGKDVVKLENVKKRFGKRELFSGLHMHVRFQDRVAIVGENGSGKTTLLSIISGTAPADSGEVQLGSSLSVAHLTQHVSEMNEEHSVLAEFRDQVTATEGEARMMLAKFLFYGHSVFKKVKDLSGGERMRLRLAQLVHQHHNVLILDEPTNHLDIESKEVLEEALARFQGTIIAVSHDRYFLDRMFNVTYWLSGGRLTRYEGNYTFAREKRRNEGEG